jgi:hypothetical protein
MKTIKISIVSMIIMMLGSCSSEYLEEAPPNLFSSETLLQDYDGFEAALNGLYNIARHARWQSEKIENAINGTDNFCSNRGRGDLYYLWGAANSPDDRRLKEHWAWLYEIIYSANNIITRSENEDVDLKRIRTGLQLKPEPCVHGPTGAWHGRGAMSRLRSV